MFEDSHAYSALGETREDGEEDTHEEPEEEGKHAFFHDPDSDHHSAADSAENDPELVPIRLALPQLDSPPAPVAAITPPSPVRTAFPVNFLALPVNRPPSPLTLQYLILVPEREAYDKSR